MNTQYLLQPAILGGRPAVSREEPEADAWPLITPQDEQAVLRVLRSGDLSFHPETQRLEDDYRSLTRRRHAVAHCNGTAALLAAFFSLQLEPGDEVLVPSATFWASVVPMLWVGAVPVFCDIEDERLGLDPRDVERKITSRTRALVVVHLFGLPCKMSRLLEIARRHDLKVIEDASHAHGAVWRSRPCGSLGHVSVFSLQTNKLAPAGEGGIFLTDERALMERAVALGDMMRAMRLESPLRRFAATTFGVKTRLAPLSAALGRSQLRRLEENNARRADNLEYLSARLRPLGVDTFDAPGHVRRVYFAYVVRPGGQLPPEQVIAALRAEGCRASAIRYPMLHHQPLFTEGLYRRLGRLPRSTDASQPGGLPRTEALSRDVIQLPAFHSASRELLDQYACAFEKVLENAEAVGRGWAADAGAAQARRSASARRSR